MNIAFDAKRAYLNNSGLGNYARTLIKSLNEYYPKNEYTLFTTKQTENEFNTLITSHPNIHVRTPESFIDKKLRSRWRSFGITEMLKDKPIDIYHGLSNELPFNLGHFKGKKIVTIHDLIFLRYPKLYPYLDRKIYNKKFRHACDIADVIIAISEETKRDIEKFYFIPENKIKVIYQSCDELYYAPSDPKKAEMVTAKYSLPEKFLLYVGTIEERKNLLTIVKAMKNVKDIPLVVIGNKKTYFNKVKEYMAANGLQNRVIVLENVAHHEMPVIYSKASIFIFPSLFEGFGIPIIEALTSKTPVITSKGGCFPEAGGPSSLYIDPLNAEELAEKINMLLNSEALRKETAEKGYEYAQRFHPKTVSEQIMNLYKS